MKLLRIPLLCKERLGEVESWGHREAKMVSAIECCGEGTSPPPLFTKDGDSRTISQLLPIANVGRTNYLFELLWLMSWQEEVEDGFDWVKGGSWDFHENGVPLGHGSIPEPRQFERFQLTTLI